MKRNKKIPENIASIIKQLKEMGKRGEINFAFAFAYLDDNGQYWFEAHTGGTPNVLKPLFQDDTNAEAIAKLNIEKAKENDFIYFSKPSAPLTSLKQD
jgi:hypothetical protein